MEFIPATLNGAYIIKPIIFSDDRGWFARTFCKKEFSQIGLQKEWVQLNHSFTSKKGTIRGMHYQNTPYCEVKLVRCIAGAIYDVIVDLREGSPTFLKWFGAELSAFNMQMLYIPEGFAHGFQTLTDNCELIYHHTTFYAPAVEGGIRFDDKRLNIQWPLHFTALSDRDLSHPAIDEFFTGIKL